MKYHINSYHEVIKGYNHSKIHIEASIDNVGDRGTTIKDIYLNKIIPEKYYPEKSEGERFEVKHIGPHNSEKWHIILRYDKKFIEEEKIEIELEIRHTHGSKTLKTISNLVKQE